MRPKDGNAASKEITTSRLASQMSALYCDGLRELIKQHGIKSIIIAGLVTSGVVMRMTTSAADEGLVVTVLKDACADRDVVKHEVILEVLQSQAHVVGVEEAMVEFAKVWKVGLKPFGAWRE